MFDPKAQNNLDFDTLQIDNWKSSLNGKPSFTPLDSKNNPIKFNLERLVKSFMDLKPDFGLILGSDTTPPCQGNIYSLFPRICLSHDCIRRMHFL